MAARLDLLLEDLAKRGASVLHLVPGALPHARVRCELVPMGDDVLAASDVEALFEGLLAPPLRERLASSRRITFAVERAGVRYRASVVRTGGGLTGVLRTIPARVPSLAELGCPEVIWRLADARSGLVLVVGPPGSGKSTTAAALVAHVNKTRACTVVTIEDPIEVVHEPLRAQIVQREIGTHTASREVALREAARGDAEVVAIADLATPAEARLACELAASGVLVIATFVASGVVDGVERLVAGDVTTAPGVRGPLADVLLAVVGQRIVPAEGRAPVVAHEVLLATETSTNAIRAHQMSELVSVMQSGAAAGMGTHDMALERLLQMGRITADTALEMASDREVLAKVVTRKAKSRKPS